MKILLIGDIFGTMGREMIKENLEEIRTKKGYNLLWQMAKTLLMVMV